MFKIFVLHLKYFFFIQNVIFTKEVTIISELKAIIKQVTIISKLKTIIKQATIISKLKTIIPKKSIPLSLIEFRDNSKLKKKHFKHFHLIQYGNQRNTIWRVKKKRDG